MPNPSMTTNVATTTTRISRIARMSRTPRIESASRMRTHARTRSPCASPTHAVYGRPPTVPAGHDPALTRRPDERNDERERRPARGHGGDDVRRGCPAAGLGAGFGVG